MPDTRVSGRESTRVGSVGTRVQIVRAAGGMATGTGKVIQSKMKCYNIDKKTKQLVETKCPKKIVEEK